MIVLAPVVGGPLGQILPSGKEIGPLSVPKTPDTGATTRINDYHLISSHDGSMRYIDR